MKQHITVFLALLLSLPFSATAMDQADAKQLFAEATQAYEDAEWEKAYLLYDSVATEYRSFELCYNAGNAAYKAGKLAQSILYYERAKKIDPTNDDLLVNLTIANERVVDRIETLPSLGVEDLISILTATNRLSTWTNASLLLNFLGFLLLIIYLFVNQRAWRKALLGIGLALIVTGLVSYGFAYATWSRVQANTTAVILDPKVDVKTSPSRSETNAFILHEGTLVKIQGENAEWYEIRLANGAVGWISKEALVLI